MYNDQDFKMLEYLCHIINTYAKTGLFMTDSYFVTTASEDCSFFCLSKYKIKH